MSSDVGRGGGVGGGNVGGGGSSSSTADINGVEREKEMQIKLQALVTKGMENTRMLQQLYDQQDQLSGLLIGGDRKRNKAVACVVCEPVFFVL